MKFFLFLFILLSLFSYGFGQKEYTRIPRTRVSIVIPEGYTIMTSSTGLQKGGNQGIMIMDVAGGSFFRSTQGLNRSEFENKGLIVYEYKDTSVNGFPAKYIIVNTNDSNLNSILLAFGDSTFFTMLTSVHQAKNKQLENSLKEALLTVTYDTNTVIDPFEKTSFSFDTLSTTFKFSFYSSNSYYFTPEGKDNPKEKTLVTLIPIPFDKTNTLDQLSDIALSKFKSNGFYGYINDITTNYQVDGADALLKIGNCIFGVEKIYHHQLLLVQGDVALMIYGICDDKNENMKAEIARFCSLIRINN